MKLIYFHKKFGIAHNVDYFGNRKSVIANILVLLVVVVFFSFGSCQKTPVLDCFIGTGNIVKEERQLGQFQTIVLKDNMNLILQKSNTNSLVVEAGSNLMGKIVTEVENDSVLTIRNDNRCNWVRSFDEPLNVYVNFQQLDILEYRSIGNVTNVDTLRVDSLCIDVREGAGKIKLLIKSPLVYCNLHYGTADIVLSGKADLAYVFGDGFGRIDNRDFTVNQVYVTNKSSNDMFLNANLRLGATIENIGNIYYRGNPPEIELQQLSSGQLIKME